MRAAFIALSLVLLAHMFVQNEEFSLLEEAEAQKIVQPDPKPEKLFKSHDEQHVKITAYTPDPKENWHGMSGSAFGTKLTVGTIAVSRDLYKRGWKEGRKVHVEGFGIFKVNDLMNKRFRNKIDILVMHKKQACEIGLQCGRAILLSEAN